MSNWIPLHVHSQYSLLDGLPSAERIADRISELGLKGCALTDHGSLSGSISFYKKLKSKSIDPILGCEFYICENEPTIKNEDNKKLSHLCVLAKQDIGWKNLVKASSISSSPENFYRKPRLDLKTLASISNGSFIVFSGHPGSDLGNCLFTNLTEAYRAETFEHAKSLIDPNWEKKATDLAYKYADLFGKENFYLEIQLIDSENIPATKIIAKALRHIAKKHGFKTVATPDAHYARKEDAVDQRVLLACSMKKTLNDIRNHIQNDEDFGFSGFFKSNNYHIPSFEEISKLNSNEEIENTFEIFNRCKDYSILKSPMLPKITGDSSSSSEIKRLCREGWKKRFSFKKEDPKFNQYGDRVTKELEVITSAGLEDYFLIVYDYCNWAREQGWLIGKGRGSGAGCMVSYLLGITEINPIENGLLFERFYNSGRNAPGRISLPDIDCDFPISKREEIINYIKNKYGNDKVSQISVFTRMQGRGALKDVLRIHAACSFEESNLITKHIPDEAEITEELQEMRDEGQEPSIIRWALENCQKDLDPYCKLKDDGTLEGQYAKYFAQAIRMEGTKRSQSKHAAGIVIASENLQNICPMIYDKTSHENIAGLEMSDLESIGLVKFDILGVAVLDKMMGVQKLLAGESL